MNFGIVKSNFTYAKFYITAKDISNKLVYFSKLDPLPHKGHLNISNWFSSIYINSNCQKSVPIESNLCKTVMCVVITSS